MKTRAIAMLATCLETGTVTAQDAGSSDQPKWFVLRNAQSAQCWTVLLTRIQGVYRHGSGRIAAGPFDTEAKAMKGLENLNAPGVCAKK